MNKHKHLFAGFDPLAPVREGLRAERLRAERAAQEERAANTRWAESENARARAEGEARGRAFRAAEERAGFAALLASAGEGDALGARIATTYELVPRFGMGPMSAPAQSERCLVAGTTGVAVHAEEAWLVLSWGASTHSPVLLLVGRPADIHAVTQADSKGGAAARAMLKGT